MSDKKMDPANLTPEEQMHLDQARLDQILFEVRNKILAAAQTKVANMIGNTAIEDRAVTYQAALEAHLILAARYEEEIRLLGMPSILVMQTKADALSIAAQMLLKAASQQVSPIILPGEGGG